MKKTKLTMLTIGAIALALPFASQAKERKTFPAASASPSPAAAASPAAKGERAIPFHGKVSAVDAAAKTFSTTSKEGKVTVYKIVSASVITKAGNPATFADIVKDEDIRGAYWKKADGSLEVKTAKVGPKTAEEMAADEARKAKKAAKAASTAKP